MSSYLFIYLFIYLFYKFKFLNKIFGVQFCNIAQNGDHPQEDLARFGYKLHMKGIFF